MPTALLADDESLLREHLRDKLAALWPELEIIGEASNGTEAAVMIAKLTPDIAFLDIKMPGQTGIEVAQGIETATRVVFVTAYDQYAVEAFDGEAVDYVLKPISNDRLARTVARLREALAAQTPAPEISQILNLLANAAGGKATAGKLSSALLATSDTSTTLRWIRANRGDTTYQISVAEVLWFESDDKYTVVHTANGEYLITKPLTELLMALDPDQFWRVHRAAVVNVQFIASSKRDGDGRMLLNLKGGAKPVAVSRAYQHLFRHM